MGQVESDEPVSGEFYCAVYIIQNGRERVIEHASDYFFEIDDGSWENITDLMLQHLTKFYNPAKPYYITGGFGGDEGAGTVTFTLPGDINYIPSMMFEVGKVAKMKYKLKGEPDIGMKTYKMKFMKRE